MTFKCYALISIMMVTPQEFSDALLSRVGEEGRQWLETIPQLVTELSELWNLKIIRLAGYGTWAVVFEVAGTRTPSVLKLTWPGETDMLAREVQILDLWSGRGAVKLFQADLTRQAVLLEKLDFRNTLATCDLLEAIPVAGALLRKLALPAPDHLGSSQAVAKTTSSTLLERWERHARPIPKHMIETTFDLLPNLHATRENVIVNWDLQYSNVLRGDREPWLVIDPQVVAGDLEYGLAQLLWWRLEEIEAQMGVETALQTLVEYAQLDTARAYAWVYVRTVDYLLFGLEVGLTYDPLRCERLLGALDNIKTTNLL